MPHLLYNLLMLAVDVAAIRAGRQVSGALINTSIALFAGSAGLVFWGWQAFGMMQAVSWLLFVHLPVLLMSHKRSRLLAIPLLLVGLDAFIVEPRWLSTSTHTLPLAGLTEPVRLALVADLQTDRVGRYETRVLEALSSAEPDLVLFAGDYIQLAPGPAFEAQADRLRPLLSALSPRLGAFAVSGDVDPAPWPTLFDGTPVVAWTQSTTVDLGPLVVTGLTVDDSRSPSPPVSAQPKPHVVVGHGPDFALAAPPADLLLAGHTHGGQVQLPLFGPLLTLSAVPRGWAAGGGMVALPQGGHLRVSRGIGMERAHAPRLRFLCRPELVFIELVPLEP